VLTAKKILDCCPVYLQRLMQSLQSKVSGFSLNRVYQKQDIFMLLRTLLSTGKPSKTGSLDLASCRLANVLETT
jgi:hypothetical protein